MSLDLNEDRSLSVSPQRASMQWEPLHHHDRDPRLEPLPQEDSDWLHHLDTLLCADGAGSQLVEVDRAEGLGQSSCVQRIRNGTSQPLSGGPRAPVSSSRLSTYPSIKSAFPEPHKINRLGHIRQAIDLDNRSSRASPFLISDLHDKRASCGAYNDWSMQVAANLYAEVKMSKGRKRLSTRAVQALDAKSACIRSFDDPRRDWTINGSAEAEAVCFPPQEEYRGDCATLGYHDDCRPTPMPVATFPFTSAPADITGRSKSSASPSLQSKPKPVMVTTQPSMMAVSSAVRTSPGPRDGHQMGRCAALDSGHADARDDSHDNEARLLKARDAWEQLIASLSVKPSRKAWLPESNLFFSAMDQGIYRDTGRQLEQEYVVCRTEQAAGGGRELCDKFVSKLRQVGSAYLAHLTPPSTPIRTLDVQATQPWRVEPQAQGGALACAACTTGSAAPYLSLMELTEPSSRSAPPSFSVEDALEDFSTTPVSSFTWPELEEAILDELSAENY